MTQTSAELNALFTLLSSTESADFVDLRSPPPAVEEPSHILEEELMRKERKKCADLFAELMASVVQQPKPQWPDQNQAAQQPPSPQPQSLSSPTNAQWTAAPPQKRLAVKSEERPHKCDECGKGFRFKSNLFEHKSLHLGSAQRTPFVCPFCGKQCRLKGNLKKHLQVHVSTQEDLERLWKRSFSRNSGRPRKNAPPAPLPRPGDDLGLVPVVVQQPQQSANSHGQGRPAQIAIKWTLVKNKEEVEEHNFAKFLQFNMLC